MDHVSGLQLVMTLLMCESGERPMPPSFPVPSYWSEQLYHPQ
jgi:hypothetical protein